MTEEAPIRPVLAGVPIRVLARRTGIAPGTLRIWERRYGFPRPDRRPGGARVYLEADVAKLELVARALEAGFRPGDVVPLGEAEIARLLVSSGAPGPSSTGENDSDRRVESIITALIQDDVVRVRSLLRSAATALGPLQFVTTVARPLAVRVGELWAAAEIDVRHEHIASDCLTTQLRSLLAAHEEVGARGPIVVLATFPGETHLLPLEMVAVYLAARHARPRLLGRETPPEQIAEAARRMAARAIGISISPAAERKATSSHVRRLHRFLPGGTALWLGGAGAPAAAEGLDGVACVTTWDALDAALASKRSGRAA